MTQSKKPNDGIYRRLFSHPLLVEDLVRRFVGGAWVESLQFDTLELVNAHYVSQELEQREDDLVWRLRHQRFEGESSWFYVYLLLEMQSSVDRFMALRIAAYISLLYQDLARRGELTEERLLPPVLPLVLYNGEKRWWAARELESLIDDSVPELRIYRPRFRYEIIDEIHLPREVLADRVGPVAAVFEVEQSRSASELRESLHRLLETLDRNEYRPVRRDIETWLRRVIRPRRFPETSSEHSIETPGELKESWSMLEQRIEKWEQEFLARGREEGRAEGARFIFAKMFRLKFGRELTSAEENELAQADTAQLEEWSERILTADGPEDVFEDVFG